MRGLALSLLPLLVIGLAAACSEAPETSSSIVVTPAVAPDGEDDLFVDATAEAGIDFVHHVGDGRMDNLVESVGSGAVWFDADGDGRLDLYLVDGAWDDGLSEGGHAAAGSRNRLYRNRGDGTFADVTARAGVGDESYGFMACAADLDGDGDQDLYVLNHGKNRLFRNRGDGTFEDATAEAGVACELSSVAGGILDANGDGWLDIYVGNYLEYDPAYRTHYAPDVFPGPLAFSAQPDVLYLNAGDGTFRDASADWGLDAIIAGRAMGVSTLDYDGDGDTDVFVANDASANFLLRNDGDRFEEVALAAGVAFGVNGEATAAMCGAVGDLGADGLPDIHVTDARYGSLYRNQGDGTFVDRIFPSGIGAPSAQWASWGGGFLDADDDGDLDLLIVNGDLHRSTGRRDLLLENAGDGSFGDWSGTAGAYFRAEMFGRGAAFADYDDDGDVDVLVTCIGDRPVLLRHRGNAGTHFVGVALRGEPGRVTAYGARVTVEAGGRKWTRCAGSAVGYLSQHDQRLHFGLSEATSIDAIEIVWPDGTTQRFEDLEADRYYVVRAGEGLQ